MLTNSKESLKCLEYRGRATGAGRWVGHSSQTTWSCLGEHSYMCFCFKNNGNLKQETAMIIFLKDLSVCGRYETVKVLRL